MNTTLLQENYEKLVALGKRYFAANKRNEREQTAYYAVLQMLYKNALADTGDEVKLAIGFDEIARPICWEPEKENLFGFCPTGQGLYLYGLDIAFLDMALRYPKEKIQYFGFYGEGVPYSAIDEGHLLGDWSFWAHQEGYEPTVNAIRDCITKREAMTAEELKGEPLIIIHVATAHRFVEDNDFGKFLAEILPKAQRLKMAVSFVDHESVVADERYAEMMNVCAQTPHMLMLRHLYGNEKIRDNPLIKRLDERCYESVLYKNRFYENPNHSPFIPCRVFKENENYKTYFLDYIIFLVLTRQP